MDRVAALYRDHVEFVGRVLWRARVPSADIEDLVHDVFVVILRKLPTDHPANLGPSTPDHERAWIYRITHFEVKNYRSRARFRRMEPMDHTKEIPDPRSEAARVDDREQLLVLLDSITGQGRAVFELVELEGFSVVEAARILEITEPTAHRRLGLARQDVETAVVKLAQRDKDAGKKKTSAFLLPFGVGAWLQLRGLQNPPGGTADRVWQRLQSTITAMEQENDRTADPPPQRPPVRARLRRLLGLTRPLKRPLENLLSACLGGAFVALLFLLRPNAQVAILRMPGPVVFVTSATTTLAPPTTTVDTPQSSTLPPVADTRLPADAPMEDEETLLIRQARVAYATGNRQKTIAALEDYEAHYPAGRFRNIADTLWAALHDAGTR